MADFPLGSFSRPSDHGPDSSAVTWECGNNCGCGFVERPPDSELTRCSEPGCGEPEGTWMCPNCRKSACCECCDEPYCREHLTKAWHPFSSKPELWCASCVKQQTCPQCQRIRHDIDDYDYGIDPQTGYHDSGRACDDCRQRGRRRSA